MVFVEEKSKKIPTKSPRSTEVNRGLNFSYLLTMPAIFDYLRLAATFWNVVLAFWPIVVMAAKQTTMIKASFTAYSTAVGPSSETRN